MMDFNHDSIFNLHKIDDEKLNANIPLLLIEGEEIVGVYRTVRDQIVFTNRRIISMDIKGITGKRKEYFTIPYTKVEYFSIQTVGFLELIPDAELTLFFANGVSATYEFRGQNDIIEIGRVISEFTLNA